MSIIEQLVEDMEGSLTEAGIMKFLDKIPTMNWDQESIKRLYAKMWKVNDKLYYLIQADLCIGYAKKAKQSIDLEDEPTPMDGLEIKQKYLLLNKVSRDISINLIVIDDISSGDYVYISNIYNESLFENDKLRGVYERYKVEKLSRLLSDKYTLYKVL